MKRVLAPAPYVPQMAIACGTEGTDAVAVSGANPLPVRAVAVDPPPPLTGTGSGAETAGPFAVRPGRPVWITLTGSWTGAATLLRSTDGGATRLPLTVGGQPWAVFTGPAHEAVLEEAGEGTLVYLMLAITSGIATYRVAQ